jgi:Chaperone of endosialidase
MTISSAYPGAIAVFPTEVDYETIVAAALFNALAAEVVAIENTLGTNPAGGFSPSTIGGALSALNTGKSNSQHTHANLASSPVSIGGAITSTYIDIAGDSLQAMNGTSTAKLTMQSLGGDTSIGTANSNVAILGSFSVAGNVTFNENLVTADAQTTKNLTVTNLLALTSGQIEMDGNTIYLWNLSGPGIVAGDTTEGIYASGPYTTVFAGNNVLSTKEVIGQLYVEQVPDSSEGGYAQACIQMNRPSGGAINHFAASLGAQAYSQITGTTRQALLTFNADSATLGWISQNGAINTSNNFALTASSFITSSAAETKAAIQDLDKGLETVNKLHPVSYMQKTHTDIPGPFSPGDSKRVHMRSHGLLAEEVVKVAPEVVAYNPNGSVHGIDYGALVPMLVKSIQALNARIESLEAKNGPIG